MPPSRFNQTAWPDSGGHRDFLEFLNAVHRRHGCRSLREIGKAMHLSYTRVHDIVRGASLPVSENQTRSLVVALIGRADAETDQFTDHAAELFIMARRARDEQDSAFEPAARTGDAEAGIAAEPMSESPAATPKPPAVPARLVRRLRRGAVGLVIGAVVVLAVVVTSWAATRQPSPTTAPTTSTVLLQDSFDAAGLDPNKWEAPTRADLIYARDGVLNFVVGPSDTKGGAEARLAPRSVHGFHQIAFVVGVPEYIKAGPGGASMTLTESDGKTHRVIFGPGTEGPIVAALVCSRPECHQYDDYDPPGQYVPFAPGEQVPVRVVQSDGQLQFYARDELIAQGPRGDSPLTSFTFELYGAKEEAWHITVGSLIVSQ